METDIVISYSRKDLPRAEVLLNALEAEGWLVFWDRKLKPGASVYKEIQAKIEASRCVVVAWSHHSIDSDWVLGEADLARELKKLIPVFFEIVSPPLPFGSIHAGDLTNWNGEASHDQYRLLAEAVKDKAGPPRVPARPVTPPQPIAPEPKGIEFLPPGVYVEEIPSGLRSLEAASTSTAAFLGLTARGDVATPTFVTNFRQFEDMFAVRDGPDGGAMRRAILAFFENGGARAYVVRVAGHSAQVRGDGYDAALAATEDIRNINVLLLPGLAWTEGAPRDILCRVIKHCDEAADRMVLVDPPPDVELRTHADLDTLGLPQSRNAALYYPWLRSDNGISVPPSAVAAGIWARNDAERGVWKAPAGPHAAVHGVSRTEFTLTDEAQKVLNMRGINAIRHFDSPKPPVLWGSRTLSADPEWRYLSTRRMALFILKSVRDDTAFAVFEPNGALLWDSLKHSVGDFLNRLWRMGAFAGATPDEAFFVRCGIGETMAQGDVDSGHVIVDIGFALARPAEFTIIRISQHTGIA